MSIYGVHIAYEEIERALVDMPDGQIEELIRISKAEKVWRAPVRPEDRLKPGDQGRLPSVKDAARRPAKRARTLISWNQALPGADLVPRLRGELCLSPRAPPAPGELAQLARCETDIHADAHMRLQLRFGARQCGEHADGGQLAGFLPVEVVALENVVEQVSSEIFVGDRGELEQRPFDRPTRQPGLVGRTGSQQRIALRDGAAGRIAGSIPEPRCLRASSTFISRPAH